MPHLAPGQSVLDLLLVAYAVLILPLQSVRNGRRMAAAPDAPLLPRYLKVMLRGWIAVAAVAALWLFEKRAPAALGLGDPFDDLIGLGAVIGLLIVGATAQFRLARTMTPNRRARMRSQMRTIKILPRSTTELVVFLGVSLTAGVWEELVYRGFLFWFLMPYAGLAGAVVLSTLVFGIGHAYQGWRGVLTTTVLGLLFAIGYAASRSLWWLMAIHALIDAFGGVLTWRVLRMPEPESAPARA
jgi:membrane protease YdiL (CAAX protease family)